MRQLVILNVIVCIVTLGCGKSKSRDMVSEQRNGVAVSRTDTPTAATEKNTTQTRLGNDPTESKLVNTKGNLTVKGGEGGIRAPLLAAARTVNLAELKDLHLAIFQAITLDPGETPPDLAEVQQMVRQNHKLQKLVADGVVILTGSREKSGIFAYTQWPQRGGRHYVVVKEGVVEMEPNALQKQLESQGSVVKLSQ